nr:ribonuclease H-like domain-containing protein [Tanacetum cinerariifolium]
PSLARASSTKSWLWHQRLSHHNFNTINDLARNDLVLGLPKFKYNKEHLCPSCEQGKSKRVSHPPKPVPNSRQRLHLLYMDLCGPMRIASINGKRYVLVIVDDYSRYTWVHFLRSKDEAPELIKTFLKRITVLLHLKPGLQSMTSGQISLGLDLTYASLTITTQQPTEGELDLLFEAMYDDYISGQPSATARTVLSAQEPQAMTDPAWIDSMQEELLQFKRLDVWVLVPAPDNISPLTLKWLFKNKHDEEQMVIINKSRLVMRGYRQEEGIDFEESFLRIYNRRTKKIMETMNVSFDELSVMAFEQRSSKPRLQSELDLLFEAMYDDYIGGQPSATARTVPPAQEPQDVDELNSIDMVDGNTFFNPFANSSTSAAESTSSQNVDPSNMHTFYQPYPHEFQWTKDHPLEQVIGEPSWPVLTRNQLRSDGDMCMYTLTVSTMEPKNVK